MTTQPITIESGRVTIRSITNGVWLTQSQMADLFGVFTATINANPSIYFDVPNQLIVYPPIKQGICMGYSVSEQQRFKNLESLLCLIHHRHVAIDFPIGGSIRISKCCCKKFEQRILFKVHTLIPRIIEARKQIRITSVRKGVSKNIAGINKILIFERFLTKKRLSAAIDWREWYELCK